MSEWRELTEEDLPNSKMLVLVKRISGDIYIARRIDKPLSTNDDLSKECYWYGNNITKEYEYKNCYNYEFQNSFSDKTVVGWKYLSSGNIYATKTLK